MRSMVEGAAQNSVLVVAPSTVLRTVPLPRRNATGEDRARRLRANHS